LNYLSAFDSHLKPEVLSYSNQHPDLALEKIREVIGCHGFIMRLVSGVRDESVIQDESEEHVRVHQVTAAQ